MAVLNHPVFLSVSVLSKVPSSRCFSSLRMWRKALTLREETLPLPSRTTLRPSLILIVSPTALGDARLGPLSALPGKLVAPKEDCAAARRGDLVPIL